MGFFGDDDFFLDADDMNEEAQLSIIEETKLRILERIQEFTKKAIENVKYQESELDTNISIVERHFAELRELKVLELNSNDMTEDEILLKIQEISRSCMPMTQHEINNFTPEEDESFEDLDILNEVMTALGNNSSENDNTTQNKQFKKTNGFKKSKLNNNEDTNKSEDDDLF